MTLFFTSFDESTRNIEWDLFVYRSAMGNFYQTSIWGQVKRSQGWNSLRMIMKSPSGVICGGAQVLFKKYFGCILAIQLPKGPLFDADNQEMALSILNEIKRFFQKVPFILIIQPFDVCVDLYKKLLDTGYRKDLRVDLEETSTIIIDVSKDQADILRQIKKGKRPRFHQSESRGLVCFETTARKDLETFYSLHRRIDEKRNFGIQSRLFFDTLWEQFVPSGWCHLFMAKVDDQPVASILTITYKDTLHIYRIGWNEGYNNYYPNEGMYWFIMKWANQHHYHWVDFGGIDSEAAEAVLHGTEFPDWVEHSYSAFKLHISEQIVITPGTVEFIHPGVFAYLIRWLFSHQAVNRMLKRVYSHIRRR